jgi:hypothetical protein
MTEILPEPDLEFLAQDPTALQEPDPLQPRDIPAAKIAAGLGAAYLGYRYYMHRRLQEEVGKLGPRVTRKALTLAASTIWNSYVPIWVSRTAPYLVAGYVEGMREARSGQVPEEMLRNIAEGYATELGKHLNDVSVDAMASGFSAQVNRKVPPALAARRVTDAYGVPKRGMNALVSVWTSEEKARLTDQPLPSAKEDRAKYIIQTQNALRARQVGETEAWTAKTQAKQVVWVYGQQHGIIPKNARRVWITAHDERVCPTCGPMDGKSAKIGEKFATDAGKLWTPPAHVNCRCDVALDLAPTEDMQDAITQLIEGEKVSKSRPGDPYDRDRSGRFSSVESRSAGRTDKRPYKEREAGVDALLAQVNEKLRQAERPALKPPPQGPAKLKGPLKPLPGPPKAGPQIGGPKLAPLGPTRPKPKLNVRMGPAMAPPQSISRGTIDTEDAIWYELPGHSLIGLYDEDYPRMWNTGDVVHTRKRQDFYEKMGTKLVPTDAQSTIELLVHNKWYDWAESETGRYWETVQTGRPRKYVVDGIPYDILPDDYYDALSDAIEGVEPGAGKDIELKSAYSGSSYDRYGDQEDKTITVDSAELARYLNLDNLIDDNRPVLIEIAHISPYHMETSKNGYMTTGGIRWEVTGIREEMGDLHHLPYTVLELEPRGLEDD